MGNSVRHSSVALEKDTREENKMCSGVGMSFHGRRSIYFGGNLFQKEHEYSLCLKWSEANLKLRRAPIYLAQPLKLRGPTASQFII